MNTMRDYGAETKEHRVAGRKFAAMGWDVGSHASRHRCPDCSKKNENVVEEVTVPEVSNVTPLPRQMSRDDRRIIFAKLNDTYAGERVGYAAPWTDKKVAQDLGVPVGWIEQVREEMFGPIASNPEIDQAVVDASKVVTEMRALAQKLTQMADEAAKGAKMLHDRAERTEKRLVDIQKAVRP